MKKQSTLVFALIIWCSTALCQTPAITMTSSMAIGSDVYFTIEATNPQIQVDFGDGMLINRTIGTSPIEGTPDYWMSDFPWDNMISGKLAGSKTVKVYGTGITTFLCCGIKQFIPLIYDSITSLDVSNCTTLKWLDCSYSQFTTLDVSKNTVLRYLECRSSQLGTLDVNPHAGLEWLDCGANKLTTLDVSKNTALSTLRCSNNKFTTLDVSKNTALIDLDCSANQLTSLDVSKNAALSSFGCSANQLTTLDVSKNTALGYLFCLANQLTALDVSKNTVLGWLDCGDNPITSLDVSHNTNLGRLYCYSNKLTALDVSKNPKLRYLYCSDNQLTNLDLASNAMLYELTCNNNQLTSLDISHNTDFLTFLYCYNNRLTSLDVSKNTLLALILCHNNQFTFATLPTTPIPTVYAPQSTILIEKTLGIGQEVDLSSQLTVNGNTTAYTWKTKSGATLLQGTDYTLTDGKTVFLKSQSDSVYCEMTNATFPLFTGTDVLKTTFAKVTINTGIGNADAHVVQIYTLNKTLYIVAPYMGQASVYDINGRLVMAKEISTGSNTIALHKGGVYLVRFTGSYTPVVKKVFAGN